MMLDKLLITLETENAFPTIVFITPEPEDWSVLVFEKKYVVGVWTDNLGHQRMLVNYLSLEGEFLWTELPSTELFIEHLANYRKLIDQQRSQFSSMQGLDWDSEEIPSWVCNLMTDKDMELLIASRSTSLNYFDSLEKKK